MTSQYSQSPWDLTQLFPSMDGPEIEKTFHDLEAEVKAFEEVRDTLSPQLSTDEFNALLDRLEQITVEAGRLGGYVGLSFAGDTQNQKVQALLARVEQFSADLRNRSLFFELWWKSLTDEEAAPFIDASGDRRYWLESMRRFKPYTLTEPEEKIINIKDITGASAMTTLYDAITNRYTFSMKDDAEEKKLTRGQLMVYAHHHDPGLREASYKELYRVYGDDGAILGQMFQTMVRDWAMEQLQLRGHTSPVGVRNLANDLDDAVIQTLLDVCEEQAGMFQRFFNLKAKVIGMDRLRRYDIYAPVSKSEKKYDFQSSVNLVMEAFSDFDPTIAEMADRVFRERRIDSEVRTGKRDGAFCASLAPGQTPWVLQNFQGEARDVATMAHELGHAVHSMLAADHSAFTFESALPLAENASTFGEMLLVDRLLSGESDEGVRRDLLFRQVDDAYATICRQAFFSMFEQKAHGMVMEGATVDDLAAAYAQNLAAQFGDTVDVAEEFKWEWVSIPHFFHAPFYVYAYSFGQLLVFSLYRQYKEDKEGFRPRYLDILRAGGSASPSEVLTRAGLDITKAEFWRGGFKVVEDLITELEGTIS